MVHEVDSTKEIDALVEELFNNKTKLQEFIRNSYVQSLTGEERQPNFIYFVSYFFTKDSNYGNGMIKITLSGELKSYREVLLISGYIEDSFDLDEVVILNWKRLDE